MAVAARGQSTKADSAGVEFFESKIRPLFVEHCCRCHGAEKQEGNLRLDSVAGIRKGGDRGPTLQPGQPNSSPMILAVRYTDQDFQMPPKGRLAPQQIVDLEAWVQRGAPMPDEVSALTAKPYKSFDFDERRNHWCYQPLRAAQPPAVRDEAWPTSPIDHFILSRLEAAGLRPAPPADRRTLIRRVSFDLTGLPPTPDEVAAFVADDSPQAWETLVDRLLDSPHYGERWARHWLDLVRYAETMGHEFDFDLFHAWRYRDYVIRAFNADVPYNQFVIEHLAGDLLSQPRRHPREGYNESILGTGFYWLGEGKHSPVDIRQEQVEHIDNRIDVLGKAFLAQTIACARCHDHKFDAISTQDYYALAGYLKSTRYQQAAIDSPERIENKARELARRKRQLQPPELLFASSSLDQLSHYLLAARDVCRDPANASHQDVARSRQLDAARLEKWAKLLASKEAQQPQHPLWVWRSLTDAKGPAAVSRTLAAARQRLQAVSNSIEAAGQSSSVFDDFAAPNWTKWHAAGEAFGSGPTQRDEMLLSGRVDQPIAGLAPAGWAHSGLLSRRLEGALRSETFEIKHRFIHYLAAGSGSRIRLVIDGFQLIRSPIYGGLTIELKDDVPAWRSMDVAMWQGHRAYIELIDSVVPPPTQAASAAMKSQEPGDGYLAIDEILFSNQAAPPPPAHPIAARLLADSEIQTPEQLAIQYNAESRVMLSWLLEQGLVDPDFTPEQTSQLADYWRVEQSIPLPMYAPAAVDGTGEDEHVLHRGNYRTPGNVAPRKLMSAICTLEQPPPREGSGRLDLALRLVDSTNPLTPRVMVNRIWQHHFGEGIVRTSDDFGRMGQPPSQPELLDYLAAEFVKNGWSIKAMHRLMLLSSTYRMASSVEPSAPNAGVHSKHTPTAATHSPHLVDPDNLLWHRMPVRRLEAEAIRDAVLAVSGRLDRTLFGESVMPHITPFMEGRGRPGASGPVDGDGRRSIYINVRRNFLPPMFLAFDFPTPFTSMGRRSTSNVPAQALTMMNGPLLVQEARRWAMRVLAEPDRTAREHIAGMYQAALARPPKTSEMEAALTFLQDQSKQYGRPNDLQAWADLAHVLFNLKEFIFIE